MSHEAFSGLELKRNSEEGVCIVPSYATEIIVVFQDLQIWWKELQSIILGLGELSLHLLLGQSFFLIKAPQVRQFY